MLPWYKVRHPWFDRHTAYRAVWYTLGDSTAWAHLVFVLPTGHTAAVQVWRCTALPVTCEYRQIDQTAFYRPLTDTEELLEWARKPATPNPDLDTDLQ